MYEYPLILVVKADAMMNNDNWKYILQMLPRTNPVIRCGHLVQGENTVRSIDRLATLGCDIMSQ